MDTRGLDEELDGKCVQRLRGCIGMWLIQRHKTAGTCDEDSGESYRQKSKRHGKDR